MQKRFVKKVVAKKSVALAPKKATPSKKIRRADPLKAEVPVTQLTLKADAPVEDYNIMASRDPSYAPPLRQISGFRFTFLTAKEIENMATVEVTSTKMSGENSVYDPRMGTISNYEKCVICSKDWKDCPNHPGTIKLPVKIPHPMCMKRISDFLTCICGVCHRLVFTNKQLRVMGILKYRGEHRFKAFLEEAKKTVRCGHKTCKKPHGKYTVTDDKFTKMYKKKSEIKKIPIAYDEVAEILLNFREIEFKLLMGMKNPDKFAMMSHPQHMILQNMCVLPPSGRPFIESNNNCNHDDLTHKLIDIAKIVSKLNEGNLNPKSRIDLEDSLMFHVKTYMDNGKNKARDPAGKRPLKAIKQRLVGKGGQIRGNVQGKRVDSCGRTVISPDANLHVNEIGVPKSIADTITYPVRVNQINKNNCQQLLEEGNVNHVTRGNTRIDLKFAMYTRGFKLLYGDKVVRDGKEITLYDDAHKTFKLINGDSVIRAEYVQTDGEQKIKRKLYKNVEASKRKPFELKIGDEIERKMANGDWAIFNRQPTLHEAGMRAKQVRIHDGSTFQFDLASTSAYNADFDGDEMNLLPATSYTTSAELAILMSTEAQFINAADSKPMLAIKQDAMVGGYLFTYGDVPVKRNTFMDVCCVADWDMEYICNKIKHIREAAKWLGIIDKKVSALTEKNDERKEYLEKSRTLLGELKIAHKKTKLSGESTKAIKEHFDSVKALISSIKKELERFEHTDLERVASDEFLYSGHGTISMLFPDNFEYYCDNKMSPTKEPVKISRGVLYQGTLNKAALGSSSGSLIHHLYKDFGSKFACDFVTFYQRFMNLLLERRGFSVGIQDCIPHNNDLIKSEFKKCFLQARTVMETENDLEVRESKVMGILNDATNIGEKITKDALSPDNNFVSMITSGAKGSMFNVVHITSAIGQQNIEGKRVKKNYGGRSLPCYKGTPGQQFAPDVVPESVPEIDDADAMATLFQSRGFVLSSFYQGLSPPEFFFLSAGGREGLIDSSVKTAKCGYLSRRLLKMMEDVKISYGGMVTNSRGSIVQFCYGEDNLSATELIKTNHGMQITDVDHVANMLNTDHEWENRDK